MASANSAILATDETEDRRIYLAPGEEVIDSDTSYEYRQTDNVLDSLIAFFGMGTADFIRAAAVALNESGLAEIDLNCKVCDMRYKVLYSINKIGKLKAIRVLWRSLRGKLTSTDEQLINSTFDGKSE